MLHVVGVYEYVYIYARHEGENFLQLLLRKFC